MASDYISREAASYLLEMALMDDWEPEYAQDRLSEIPAADVRPVVRGRWIVMEDLYGERALCSACGFGICVNEPGNGLPMVEHLNFCPACGADMREDKQND